MCVPERCCEGCTGVEAWRSTDPGKELMWRSKLEAHRETGREKHLQTAGGLELLGKEASGSRAKAEQTPSWRLCRPRELEAEPEACSSRSEPQSGGWGYLGIGRNLSRWEGTLNVIIRDEVHPLLRVMGTPLPLAGSLFIWVSSPPSNGTQHRTAIISKILNWQLFSRKIVLDAVNSYPEQAVRHLIGRGVKGKIATPLDPSVIIQLNPHLSSPHHGHSSGQGAADSPMWEPPTLCPPRAHSLMGNRSKPANR